MDGERFDHLTRRLADSPSRRRLLRSAAGALIGAVLAGRTRVVQAETCDECQARGLACCSHLGTPFCRAANQTCCGPIICAEGFACVGGFCVACPSEKKCGSTCCDGGQSCENEECVDTCPTGTTRCGSNCCNEGQDCSDGQCVDACPVGVASQRAGGRRSGKREVTAEAACPSCPTGTVKCRGACVLACRGKRSLDGTTCKCTKKRCADGKVKCGGDCTDPQFDNKHCGGCAGNGGESCNDGICCNGKCEPAGAVCCGSSACNPGQTCCNGDQNLCCNEGEDCCNGNVCCAGGRRCCGETCCPENMNCVSPTKGFCCPFGTSGCGNTCCTNDEVCTTRHNHCCPKTHPHYCAKVDRCAINRRDCP